MEQARDEKGRFVDKGDSDALVMVTSKKEAAASASKGEKIPPPPGGLKRWSERKTTAKPSKAGKLDPKKLAQAFKDAAYLDSITGK